MNPEYTCETFPKVNCLRLGFDPHDFPEKSSKIKTKLTLNL